MLIDPFDSSFELIGFHEYVKLRTIYFMELIHDLFINLFMFVRQTLLYTTIVECNQNIVLYEYYTSIISSNPY